MKTDGRLRRTQLVGRSLPPPLIHYPDIVQLELTATGVTDAGLEHIKLGNTRHHRTLQHGGRVSTHLLILILQMLVEESNDQRSKISLFGLQMKPMRCSFDDDESALDADLYERFV